jgi:hypothetical protein
MAKIDPKWTALWESLKEPARLVVLGIVAWLLTVIVPQIDEKWIPIITIALKWVDKFVHEYKTDTKTEGSFKGITGF